MSNSAFDPDARAVGGPVTQKPSAPRRAVRDPVSLEALWANSEHWDRLGTYACPDDPRLLVRDRARLGWTLNMRHKRAQVAIWTFLLGIVGLLAVAVLVAF